MGGNLSRKYLCQNIALRDVLKMIDVRLTLAPGNTVLSRNRGKMCQFRDNLLKSNG